MKSNSLNPPLPTSLLCLVLALLTGCQTYNEQIAELVTDYEAGEFSSAAETISSGDLDDALDSETDGLLFLLDPGSLVCRSPLQR